MSEPEDLDPVTRQRVRAHLDQGAERLNVYTVRRLAQARAAALNGERRQHPWLIPSLGAVVAAALLVSVTLQIAHVSDTAPVEVATFDLELLTSQDDLDMYQDLEFYAWLDDEHESS